MTIQRGQPWGQQVQSPAQLPLMSSNVQLNQWIVAQRRSGRPISPVGLVAGDLAKTLGGDPSRFPGTVNEATMDLLRVECDEHITWAASHVVGFRAWWRGEAFLAMNAQFYGKFDVAPRSHPNDGKVDVVHIGAAMPVRQRRLARSRALTGTHLPHPHLTSTQSAEVTLQFETSMVLWVDGVRWQAANSVRITVEPDAFVAFF